MYILCSIMGTEGDIFDLIAAEPTLKEAIQDDLSRLREMQMRFAGRLDRAAEKEERPERLSQLNNAAVKTARAVRQIAVLQLEIAGDRPVPNARAAPTAPANQNKSSERPKPKNGPRPCPRPWEKGDYTDYDDYTDNDRLIALRAGVDERRRRMVAAMNEDFRAAGREDVCGQSPKTKFGLILGIPHPAFDACIQEIEPEWVYRWIGDENITLTLGPGPPDAWAQWDERERLYGDPNKRKSG